jgi:hypothetical protein
VLDQFSTFHTVVHSCERRGESGGRRLSDELPLVRGGDANKSGRTRSTCHPQAVSSIWGKPPACRVDGGGVVDSGRKDSAWCDPGLFSTGLWRTLGTTGLTSPGLPRTVDWPVLSRPLRAAFVRDWMFLDDGRT